MRPKKVILLVDSEHQSLSTRRFMLKTRGYKVLAAMSSADAVEILSSASPGSIDLMICEMFMSEMDGNELVRRAKPIHPEMRTMLISRKMTTEILSVEADAYLPKGSSSPVEVIERVRLLLNRKRGPKKRVLKEMAIDLAKVCAAALVVAGVCGAQTPEVKPEFKPEPVIHLTPHCPAGYDLWRHVAARNAVVSVEGLAVFLDMDSAAHDEIVSMEMEGRDDTLFCKKSDVEWPQVGNAQLVDKDGHILIDCNDPKERRCSGTGYPVPIYHSELKSPIQVPTFHYDPNPPIETVKLESTRISEFYITAPGAQMRCNTVDNGMVVKDCVMEEGSTLDGVINVMLKQHRADREELYDELSETRRKQQALYDLAMGLLKVQLPRKPKKVPHEAH